MKTLEREGMHITIEIPDEIGEKLKALPNQDEFATYAIEQAINQLDDRTATELEQRFVLKSLEDVKNDDLHTDEEMREYYKNKGIEF